MKNIVSYLPSINFPEALKFDNYQTFVKRFVGLSDCWTIGLSDQWTV